MKNYEQPIIEIILLDNGQDVITASGNEGGDDNITGPGDGWDDIWGG